MGTRHIIFVTLNNETKIAQYGQWDGYPSGVGIDLLNILRGINLHMFKEQVAKLRFANPSELENIPDEVLLSKHKELSRDTSSEIIEMVLESENPESLLLVDASREKDNSWIEYCWYINLDDETFSMDNNRFATFNLNDLPTNQQFVEQCEKAAA